MMTIVRKEQAFSGVAKESTSQDGVASSCSLLETANA
jgi:hypothetical protein